MSNIWQIKEWPELYYDRNSLEDLYEQFLYTKGLADASFDLLSDSSKNSFYAETIAKEALSSSEIEGEVLIYDSVYSSVMKHLDPSFKDTSKDKNSVSVANMLFDACNNPAKMDFERLFSWNKSLFEGKSKYETPGTCGEFRNKPVYVIHHLPRGNEELIYEAVPADSVIKEMNNFISWLNSDNEKNVLIKSAIAGFWIVTIHPFEDGNGRISRAISDYVLSKDNNIRAKYYSVSASILRNKKEYYSILEQTQKSESLDITKWIAWYIRTVTDSLEQAKNACSRKVKTAMFVRNLDPSEFNSRQLQILYKLADNSFIGKLTADKWKKMTKCQSSTATRDLAFLVEKGLLIRLGGSGKNYHYILNPEKIK